MADDKETDFEDEFDFESEDDLLDDSFDDEFGNEKPAPTSKGGGAAQAGGMQKPPLPVLVGGGVAALVVVVVAVMLMSGGEEEIEVTPPPPPAPAPEPEPVPAPPPPPPPPVKDPFAQLEDDGPKITAKMIVEQIDEQDKKFTNQVRNLDRKVTQLISKLNKLEDNLGSTGADNQDIARKLEALNQELKMLAMPKQTPKDTVVVEKSAPKFVNPTLTVHAIIPGRAWLKNRDGQIMTVTEGDSVEGYGKVLAIDAPSGQVLTSSGVVLR